MTVWLADNDPMADDVDMNRIEPPSLVWHPAAHSPALEAGMVHVWRTSLEPGPEKITELNRILSPEERIRASRYLHQRDRDAFIVARGTLRCILGGYLSLAPQALEFGHNEFGKPYLQNGGASPPLHFNVSHSGFLALYAFVLDRQVGVDVEEMRRDVEVESIAQHYFTVAESMTLRALPPEHQLAAFYRCWVRKEAYIKALGRGLSIGLDHFETLVALHGPPTEVPAKNIAPEGSEWWIRDIPVSSDYAAALVVEGIMPEVSCWIYEGH
jgi:4'-phosphopantetheinyl transferase